MPFISIDSSSCLSTDLLHRSFQTLFNLSRPFFSFFSCMMEGKASLYLSALHTSAFIKDSLGYFMHIYIKNFPFYSNSSTNYISVAPIIKSFCNINEGISMRMDVECTDKMRPQWIVDSRIIVVCQYLYNNNSSE